MTQIVRGDVGAPVLPAARIAISSYTAANPTVITTATAHTYAVGDQIAITESEAGRVDGDWRVSAVGGSTTFSIAHAVMIAGGASGFVVSAAFRGGAPAPNPGAPVLAEDLVAFGQAIMSLIAYLFAQARYSVQVLRGAVFTAAESLKFTTGAKSWEITAASNTTPIQLTINGLHGFRPGDRVRVGGCTGNTGANANAGTGGYGWIVGTGSAGNQLFLQGSSGNGTYTGGGTLYFDPVTEYDGARTMTVQLGAPTLSTFDASNAANHAWAATADGSFTVNNPSMDTMVDVAMWRITSAQVPTGSVINFSTVFFQPPTGHGSVVSSHGLPVAAILRVDMKTGTSTSLASRPDPFTGSVGQYEAYAALNCPVGFALAELVDHERCSYFVRIILETNFGSPAGALSGSTVYGASVNFTTGKG